MGSNVNSLNSKRESLLKNIKNAKCGIFTLQETKVSQKGSLKIQNYVLFELLRKNKEGGCLMTGIHENLNPVLVYEDEEAEILVVQIVVNKVPIRVINAYGPQEYEEHRKIIGFYSKLEQVILNAKMEECLYILELDSNAKVGFQVIKSDPHPQSPNGMLLTEMIQRNNLYLCNASNKCEGSVSRRRVTKKGIEESILDFLIVCEEMSNFFQSMKIDPSCVLTRYMKSKGKIKIIPSDHFPLFAQFKLRWNSNVKPPNNQSTIFNFNDKKGLQQFKNMTNGNILSSVFQNGNILEESKLWLKSLKTILYKCFPVVRVKSQNGQTDLIHDKMVEKSKLLTKIQTIISTRYNSSQNEKIFNIMILKQKIEILDEEITNLVSQKNASKIQEHFAENV